MEESKKNAYIAGVSYSLISAFCLLMAFSIGWNMSGQFIGIFGLCFGGLGVGSIWKPDSIGQIAAEMLKNMQENTERERKSRNIKKNNHSNYSCRG